MGQNFPAPVATMPLAYQPKVPIYDNVHGFVSLTQAEHDIINSIYFQRLREIKQLSFANFVFAGAVHTRFSHSLGVLAVMDKLLRHLRGNLEEGVVISEHEVVVLRMAALLHDIGHYPLSHLVESSYKDEHKELRLRLTVEDEDGGVLDADAEGLREESPELIAETISVDGHHESLGAYIINNTDFVGGITHILKNHGFSETDIQEIGLIICGKSSTPWYNQLMHSELDVDRLDYLLRDSHATGVHYGNFDFDYLLNNCRLVLDVDRNIRVFCVKASALFTAEHYLLARYFWYAQIISERKIAIFDRMGKDIYKWFIKKKQAYSYPEILKAVANPLEFFKFNDNFFWSRIYKLVDAEPDGDNDYYIELARMLIERKSFKRLVTPTKKQLSHHSPCPVDCDRTEGCERHTATSKTDIDRYEDSVDALEKGFGEAGIDSRYIISIKGKVYISKRPKDLSSDELDRDPIRILESDGSIHLLNLLSHSVIKNLSNYELLLPRIYVHERFAGEAYAILG